MRARRWRPLLVVLGSVVTALSAALSLRGRLFAVAVSGASMHPAFEDGDFVLIRRRRVPLDARASGLVVCVRAPDDRLLLKRIVGVPGESLRIGTTVQVAGRSLFEPYAHGATPSNQFRGISTLAADEYLVLGDNRAASTDGRDFGPLRADRIEGAALLRYWPPERIALIRRAPRAFASADSTPTVATPDRSS